MEQLEGAHAPLIALKNKFRTHQEQSLARIAHGADAERDHGLSLPVRRHFEVKTPHHEVLDTVPANGLRGAIDERLPVPSIEPEIPGEVLENGVGLACHHAVTHGEDG